MMPVRQVQWLPSCTDDTRVAAATPWQQRTRYARLHVLLWHRAAVAARLAATCSTFWPHWPCPAAANGRVCYYGCTQALQCQGTDVHVRYNKCTAFMQLTHIWPHIEQQPHTASPGSTGAVIGMQLTLVRTVVQNCCKLAPQSTTPAWHRISTYVGATALTPPLSEEQTALKIALNFRS